MLAVAELRVVLLEDDPLRFECGHELVDVVLRRSRTDRRETEARIDGDERPVELCRERELVLERHLEPRPALREAVLHLLQERALAHRRRITVQLHVVDEHRARVRRVRQHAEGLRVGDEPDLADGPHSLDRLQLVERVHRLHRDGKADAALDTPFESVQRARLGAHRAVVPAPEEADEAETRLVRALRDLLRRHAGEIVGVGCSRRCMNSLIA